MEEVKIKRYKGSLLLKVAVFCFACFMVNEENADNTDYAEKVARRELDYVKPGERVFYNVGGNN